MRKLRDLSVRFWRHVDKRGPDECWLWTAHIDSAGYGRIRSVGNEPRIIKAHRAAYELNSGQIPDGLCVCHRCDVRHCVNPAHLFLGTLADNNADRNVKGRNGSATGERHGRAKLTATQVLEIMGSEKGSHDLATTYGVDRTYIWRIRTRKNWQNVGAPA